jgi:type II secretory pathway component GspD/PulD (secretin)
MHAILDSAIAAYRRGDYEKAAILLQQATLGQEDLTPAEVNDLNNHLRMNTEALKARREGADQVRLARDALRNGRIGEAQRLLKVIQTNQYLAAADKFLAQQMAGQVRTGQSMPVLRGVVPETGPDNDQRAMQARAKVREARALLAKGDCEAARARALEAQALGVFWTSTEDSPRKVLTDIEKVRPLASSAKPVAPRDPKILLAEARAALRRGNLDEADRLASAAEMAAKHSAGVFPAWLHPWSDTPAKIRKEVQEERRKRAVADAAKQSKQATKLNPARPSGPEKIQVAGNTAPAPSSTGRIGATTDTTSRQVDSKTSQSNATVAARTLIKQGYKALRGGNLALAREDAEKARRLHPDLQWWDDTPDKLLFDIERIEDARSARAPAKRTKAANEVVQASDRVLTHEEPAKPADARALLRQARVLIEQRKLDAAEKVCQQAATVPGTRWGLFEDSPAKLRIEINKQRVKHDQEESVRILAEGRELFHKGNLKEAKKKAYLAQKLHGPYSFWDLGDRPVKLLHEIEAVEDSNRKPKLPPLPPPTAVVKNPTGKPAGSPDQGPAQDLGGSRRPTPATEATAKGPGLPLGDEAQVAEARALLAEARRKLDRGDFETAAALKEKVQQLNAGWDVVAKGPAPWGNDLSALTRDLDQAGASMKAPDQAAGGPPVLPPRDLLPPSDGQDPAKFRARALLAEAQSLRSQNRLVEAREKVLEAQAIPTSYGPEEERPETVLMQLATVCDKRIAALIQRADECQWANDLKQVRCALADLKLAKELSDSFKVDSALVDNRLAKFKWREALLSKSGQSLEIPNPNSAGEGVVKVGGDQPARENSEPTPRDQGLALLAKARLELSHGETRSARKLAETALAGSYGVNAEAQAMLRKIDCEEWNQAGLVANRSFDAALAAYNRQEYVQAARIIDSIDGRRLDAVQAARLKEIVMMPEMQPDALRKADRPIAVAQSKNQSNPPRPFLDPAGRAKVTDQDLTLTRDSKDEGEESLTQRVMGMQEVKLSELQSNARSVQLEAIADFKAGDMDRALARLKEFLTELDNATLDPDRLHGLRRQIEDRLQKLQTLKVEREFEKNQVAANYRRNSKQGKRIIAEQEQEHKVADLMEHYHTLYKEGKYEAAEAVAQQVLEVDPDNSAASAAYMMARTQKRLQIYKGISKRKEQMDLDMLNDTDEFGPSVTLKDPVAVDAKIQARTKKRWGSQAIWPQTKSPKEQAIERRLMTPISLNFKDVELGQVIDDLRDISGVNVVADTAALEDASINLHRKVSLNVENIAMKSALNVLLQQVHLTYVIKDEVLQITTEDNAKGKMKRVVYPVADLVVPVENHGQMNDSAINFAMNNPQSVLPTNYGATPYTGPYSMTGGTSVSNPSTGASGAPSLANEQPNKPRAPGQTIEELLIKLVANTVAPETWKDVGGQGTIQYFPLGLALIINQTPDIQEQIQDLLTALRKLQDLEVAIEMRLVSVSESFFERIGIDFNVNIVNNNTKFDSQLLSGNFQPSGVINFFHPHTLVSGLTQAGTLTPDLGIPIRQNSFALTTPPFGYPGTPPDGGLSLGLAFLSDIQVFLFLEAAQGDRRINVMQAPKLTMFNGQSATLSVSEQQYFLTRVDPAFTPTGQIYFVPQNMAFPLGVNMTIQPVVSADRRFVRMNLNPTLTNLTDATVPLFPIQVVVPQFFEGLQPGPNQAGLFQMFLQQPKFSLIHVETTVSVPDGGTVLLGGLKTLSEGRSEFGPPILSKIPYVNRLFKNVGYGREAQSLMIMVTPRIIINEEEELRQTGLAGGVEPEGQ